MLKNKRRIAGSSGLLAVLALFAALLLGGAAQADEGGAKFVAQSRAAGLSADKATATIASATGAVDVGTPVTIMATCGASDSQNKGGSEAKWTVRCNSTQIWIEGWVKDTVADGQCGWVAAMYADGSTWESNRACPKGNKDTFSSPPRNGRLIEASLHQG